MIGNGRPLPLQAHKLAQTATGCLPSSPQERGEMVTNGVRPHPRLLPLARGVGPERERLEEVL